MPPTTTPATTSTSNTRSSNSSIRRRQQLFLLSTVLTTMCGSRCVAEAGDIICTDDVQRSMHQQTINIMKTLKQRFPSSVPAPLRSSLPCRGGGLLVDLQTAMYLQRRRQSTRRRKRALFYNFTGHPDSNWSRSIPYYFGLTGGVNTDVLSAALVYIEKQTCIRFSPTNDFTSSHLYFATGSSCTTFAGRNTDSNETKLFVTSACATSLGDVIRLLYNVLGALPENNRADRNNFIYVDTSNVAPIRVGDLTPETEFITATDYDYASITHAYSTQYSAAGDYTVLPRDPLYLKTIGQRVEWSFLDAKAVNQFYCSDVCASSSLSCDHGGYVDPNSCSQCRCPDGLTRQTCQLMQTQSTSSACGVSDLTATTTNQFITSPNYVSDGSGRYSDYTNCTWRISAPGGGGGTTIKIQVKFVDSFGVFEHPDYKSCFHWVEIRYRGSLATTGPRFCGSVTPPNWLVSDSSQVLILFRSRYNSGSTALNLGFKLLYRLVTCDPQWQTTVRDNVNSMGARKVANVGYLSESGCRDHCAYDLPDCVAVEVDFNPRPYPDCWVHESAADLDTVHRADGLRQYRLDPASLACRYPITSTYVKTNEATTVKPNMGLTDVKTNETTTVNKDMTEASESSDDTRLIVGVVIGCLCAVAIIVVVIIAVVIVCKRRQTPSDTVTSASSVPTEHPTSPGAGDGMYEGLDLTKPDMPVYNQLQFTHPSTSTPETVATYQSLNLNVSQRDCHDQHVYAQLHSRI